MKKIVPKPKSHKHKWVKYMLGSQVCSICGINRASTGYKYKKRLM
jgi:hypothetical protein